MTAWRKGRRVLSASLVFACAAPAGAQAPMPIFDTHLHYSEAAWNAYPPAEVVAVMDRAGVARALVSSTPDDGTLKLYAADATRFVPELRPYRGDVGAGTWTADAATPGYLAERLKRGIYVGIGEFHLFDAAAAGSEVVRAAARLAVDGGLLLHVHADAAPVEALFRVEPKLRILWAHAGFTSPPAEVGRMLEAYDNLSAELSFRAGDVAPGGRLDQVWRELLLRHAERFMIGTDTYVTGRWGQYEALIAEHRRWLEQLPRETAAAIAYGNAVALFGDGGRRELAR